MSISVPQRLAEDLERLAAEEGISKSELVRLMARSYRCEKAEAEFLELQRLVSVKLRDAGIETEEDADRSAFENRQRGFNSARVSGGSVRNRYG